MKPIDKKIDQDIKEGKVPDPIEDLPSEWSKEDRDLVGREPDLGELPEFDEDDDTPADADSDVEALEVLEEPKLPAGPAKSGKSAKAGQHKSNKSRKK